VTRLGASRDDNLLGQHLVGANLDLVQITLFADERTMTVEQGDLVLLEQALDAGGQLGNDGVLATLHHRHVDRRLADLDALGFKAVTGFLEQMRGMQQRLGRNAANVQAGTAKTRFALRVGIRIGFAASGGEAELGSADGGDIAAGSTADNEHVKLLGHV